MLSGAASFCCVLYYTRTRLPLCACSYADVVVHRQLLAALAGAPPPQPHADLAAAAHNMNLRHRQVRWGWVGRR